MRVKRLRVAFSLALLLMQPGTLIAGARKPAQPGQAAIEAPTAIRGPPTRAPFTLPQNDYAWFPLHSYGNGTEAKFSVYASDSVDIMMMNQTQYFAFQSSGNSDSIFHKTAGDLSAQIPLPSAGTFYLVVYNDQSGATLSVAVSSYTVPVDIYRQYSSIPAPTGIADYGVINKSGTFSAYRQAVAAVTGSAVLRDVSAHNSSSPPGASPAGASLQLNVMLRVNTTSGHFVYWLQNVLTLFTDNHTAYFVDSIWNYTTRTSRVSGRVVFGSGMLYAAGGKNFYAFDSRRFSYATPLSLILNVSVSHSVNNIVVSFGTRHASGGGSLPERSVAYDNVSISEFHDVKDAAIVVDGFEPDPTGTFYDAELVFGGQCCYQSTTFTAMDSTLSMSYRTAGGEVASPLSLFEFGSDTGEGAYNLATFAGRAGFNVSLGRISFATDYVAGPGPSPRPSLPFSVTDAAIVGLAAAALVAAFTPLRRKLRLTR